MQTRYLFLLLKTRLFLDISPSFDKIKGIDEQWWFLPWIHSIMSFIKKRKLPKSLINPQCVFVFGFICLRACLHVAQKEATKRRLFFLLSACHWTVCSSARAGLVWGVWSGGWWGFLRRGGWTGQRGTSKQQRAAGAIIPPNARCLPQVCGGSLVSGRLSALMQKVTLVIKCSSQGWGWGAAQAGCLQQTLWALVHSEQQQK